MKKPLIWAHRGASFHAPENTLPAFSLAVEMDADGVELDIHLSSDGEIVVAHDETLSRATGESGFLGERSLRQLKELDFSRPIAGYAKTTIPTLEEVFTLIRPSNLMINIELKNTQMPYEGMEEKVLSLSKAMGMQDRVLYSSFNHVSLHMLREMQPSARVGLLYSVGLYAPWDYARMVRAQALHPHFANLRMPDYVPSCHENAIEVNVWTVDEKQDMQTCRMLGVDGIITNRPDLAKE